ncbi:hypothetical protein Glove_66g167 [Diversispora epigaea]|uniref:Crinkler effector protein N-terminal domain-containing protein n=1 Tax=Diversispora epigaea TaxID=1348612 RepID=A0A397JHD4_9GLOM|nr:hypothetical protein Glove_66g167 [Diversispora epigaea]
MSEQSTSTTEQKPAPEVVQKYNTEQLITFFCEKEDLQLDDDDYAILRNEKITGRDFLNTTKQDYGMKGGPATRLADFAKEIKGEQPGAEPPNKRVKIADDDLNKFWRALKNAPCDNKFLKLSEDTRFLGKERGSSTLFIRKCYRDLENVVLDHKIDKLRITGNPGIGKTFFGYYLLYLLAQQDATVVYDNYNETKPFVFEGKNAFIINSDYIDVYLRKKAVWYIVDGKEPKDVNAKTILVCLPKREHYWNFDKYTGVVTIRYMPTWKWKEIKECWQELYPQKIKKETARDLFMKWGGIPRFVLEKGNDETHQNKLTGAIPDCKMDIFDFIGESSIGKDDISHMIVHLRVNLPVEDDDELVDDELVVPNDSGHQLDRNGNTPYTLITVRFASDYVREKVTLQLEARIRERLLEKTKAGTGSPLLGSSFEYMAHRILQNGGNFDVRPLEEYNIENYDDPLAKVNLPQQPLPLYFDKNTIDKIENNKYYQPSARNFPSINSIIAPNKVFQMTIAKDHPIKMSGLKALYNKFGGETANHLIYYYFVVPEHLYKDYKAQKIVNSDGDDTQIIPNWINRHVFQYVLKIKL